MRAIQVTEFAPKGNTEIQQVTESVPGFHEVVINAHFMALNFPDLLLMQGNYQLKPSLPFTLGRDVAGIVQAVGEGVDEFSVGDRVCGQLEYGAFSELVVCPVSQCYQLPDGISLEEGAALGLAYQTAYFALMQRARFKAGESVLILGAAGSVGLATVQLVKALGGSIIAGVMTTDQAEIVKANGADHVVYLEGDDLKNSLRDQVNSATDGKGADVVIDPVGGEVFSAALRCLAWQGRLVVVGFAAGGIPEVRVNYLLLKNIEVSGLQWTSYRDFEPESTRQAQDHIFKLYNQGALRPPRIARIYPLEHYKDALTDLERGGMNGKLLLTTVDQ